MHLCVVSICNFFNASLVTFIQKGGKSYLNNALLSRLSWVVTDKLDIEWINYCYNILSYKLNLLI